MDDDLIDALAAALSEERFAHLWQDLAELAHDPDARYGGRGAVQTLISSERPTSDQWILRVTIEFGVVLGVGGDDVRDYEVTFRVFGANFPPEIDDLEVIG